MNFKLETGWLVGNMFSISRNKVNDKSNFTNTKNVFFHLMNAHFRAIGHPSKYYTYKRQALLHSQNILKADRWNI